MIPGAGTCAACRARAFDGHLMCPRCWRKVPNYLKSGVIRAFNNYRYGMGTIADVRKAQKEAVLAIGGWWRG